MGANDSTMKPLTRRIIGVVVVLVLVGVGVLALRTLPVLPSIAARQIAADLTSGQLRSQAWTNPDDGDDLAGIVTDLAAAGPGTRRVTVDGVVQPGEELLIAATCPGQDVRADLDTSFGESTTMSPGADVGKLIGYVTLPADFTDEGATATITCSSGVTDTVTIN